MPDRTMIDRVAMTLSPSAFTGRHPSKNAQGAEQARALASARAVTAVMREPTEAKAVDDDDGKTDENGYLDYLSADNIWRAMIDAALEDER